jgi:hypothetical protein
MGTREHHARKEFWDRHEAECHTGMADEFKDTSLVPIFCDIDGVLTDFTSSLQNLYKQKTTMGKRATLTPQFFARLPRTKEGKLLWERLKRTPNPVYILMGRGVTGNVQEVTKLWCKCELGECEVHITKPWLKHQFCIRPGSILVG